MPQMPRIGYILSYIYMETKTKTPQENKCLEMGKMTKLIWMSIELPSHWTTSTLRRQYWKLLRFLNIIYWSPTLARISAQGRQAVTVSGGLHVTQKIQPCLPGQEFRDHCQETLEINISTSMLLASGSNFSELLPLDSTRPRGKGPRQRQTSAFRSLKGQSEPAFPHLPGRDHTFQLLRERTVRRRKHRTAAGRVASKNRDPTEKDLV